MTVEAALKRYLREVSPTKRESTQTGEHKKAKALIQHLRKYWPAAHNAEIIDQLRDMRLAGNADAKGEVVPRSTIRCASSGPCLAICSLSRSRNGA
jgi:hypothetical protein